MKLFLNSMSLIISKNTETERETLMTDFVPLWL